VRRLIIKLSTPCHNMIAPALPHTAPELRVIGIRVGLGEDERGDAPRVQDAHLIVHAPDHAQVTAATPPREKAQASVRDKGVRLTARGHYRAVTDTRAASV
jgi:hypothetical protein